MTERTKEQRIECPWCGTWGPDEPHRCAPRNMRRYTLPFGQSVDHTPKNPERTARRPAPGAFGGIEYQEWSNRPAMARSIRMQERTDTRRPWRPVVKLTETEGH